MPRRGNIPKRDVLEDPIYNSKIVTHLINKVMLDGKRSVAEQIVYGSLDLIRAKLQKEPLEVLETAMKNVQPILEVRARRVGGATYQVPMEVRPQRRSSLAYRWLVDQSRQRGEKTMAERLAGEIMDAASNAGGAVRKREEMHRMAEANKAFAHYRW